MIETNETVREILSHAPEMEKIGNYSELSLPEVVSEALYDASKWDDEAINVVGGFLSERKGQISIDGIGANKDTNRDIVLLVSLVIRSESTYYKDVKQTITQDSAEARLEELLAHAEQEEQKYKEHLASVKIIEENIKQTRETIERLKSHVQKD